MTLTRRTDHFDAAYGRLLEEFKDVEDFAIYIKYSAARWQVLEDTAWDVYTHDFLNATGATLDLVGKLLAEPRLGDDDETYKVRLQAKILVLRSSGTMPQLLKIFKLLLPANIQRFEYYSHASFALNVGQISTALLPIYVRFLRQAALAGVDAVLQYSESTPAGTFRFDVGPGFDTSHMSDGVKV